MNHGTVFPKTLQGVHMSWQKTKIPGHISIFQLTLTNSIGFQEWKQRDWPLGSGPCVRGFPQEQVYIGANPRGALNEQLLPLRRPSADVHKPDGEG